MGRPATKRFAPIEWALVAAITLTVGSIAYGVYSSAARHPTVPEQSLQHMQDKHADTAIEVPVVPAIETTADLDKAQHALDQVDLEASANDEKELESQADF